MQNAKSQRRVVYGGSMQGRVFHRSQEQRASQEATKQQLNNPGKDMFIPETPPGDESERESDIDDNESELTMNTRQSSATLQYEKLSWKRKVLGQQMRDSLRQSYGSDEEYADREATTFDDLLDRREEGRWRQMLAAEEDVDMDEENAVQTAEEEGIDPDEDEGILTEDWSDDVGTLEENLPDRNSKTIERPVPSKKRPTKWTLRSQHLCPPASTQLNMEENSSDDESYNDGFDDFDYEELHPGSGDEYIPSDREDWTDEEVKLAVQDPDDSAESVIYVRSRSLTPVDENACSHDDGDGENTIAAAAALFPPKNTNSRKGKTQAPPAQRGKKPETPKPQLETVEKTPPHSPPKSSPRSQKRKRGSCTPGSQGTCNLESGDSDVPLTQLSQRRKTPSGSPAKKIPRRSERVKVPTKSRPVPAKRTKRRTAQTKKPTQTRPLTRGKVVTAQEFIASHIHTPPAHETSALDVGPLQSTPPPSLPLPTAQASQSFNTQKIDADVPPSSVKQLVSLMRRDLEQLEPFCQQSPSKGVADFTRLDITRLQNNLADPTLKEFLDEENRIESAEIPATHRKRYLKHNLKKCLEARSWRGGNDSDQ